MEEHKPEKVDYFIYEGEMARAERHARRWMIACIIAFCALIVSNVGWVIYESQYQDVVTTVSQESSSDGGGDAIINGTYAGAVMDGESKTDDNN